MTKITILGAGGLTEVRVDRITGLAIASQLPRNYDVTIVARDLPGDWESHDWASPWAGAIWMGVLGSNEREQRLQMEAYAYLWKLAHTNPESSVRRIGMDEIMDYTPDEKEIPWYHGKLPGRFRIMAKDELPEGASYGMHYKSLTLQPISIMDWLYKRLLARGVKFQRLTVQSLADLNGLGHDVLVNATGLGSRYLKDVKDEEVLEVRSQIVLVKSNLDRIYLRHGKEYTANYTYALPRLDGKVILGGIRQYGETNFETDQDTTKDILSRVHKNLPQHFPSNSADFKIIQEMASIQPQREIGLKVEKSVVDGQKIVHAYGILGGGYILSFGLAKEVVDLVNEFEFAFPSAKL